ncbi:MAG TPA: LutB/LldF family L-lactate oxidation iron-sulfur protein, partial [Hyphomicrobiales bacterium]|nr:LutB/LldF family L-lactate oxidation iron-sulfur protein [Hyphomicrobiales bacterium]
MQPTSANFKENAGEALRDPQLQRALGNIKTGFISKRAEARAALPEFDALRRAAADVKNHVLEHLDIYLEEYERKVIESGGHVHWARNAAEAREIILKLCREAGAKTVTKGKSMVSEEIGLNEALEAEGIEPVETDLGEYVIQIRHETPSHIIAPAIHLNKDQVEQDFRALHRGLQENRPLLQIGDLVGEARTVLRQKFLAADVGITGANFLIAETGSSVIVTNEGNGDLTQLLPRVHIVVASIEKLVPTLEDVSTVLRVLARSATGQEMSSYTTFSTGPRREGDPDGPGAYHVVLLDNGRSEMLGGDFQDMLRCIRCGACLNHCPVYAAVGGHAYGWVYTGPMGAVLTPQLIGIQQGAHLPNASTFCGRCQSVCPMNIPLPKMMRHWRERDFLQKPAFSVPRLALRSWAALATRPRLYRFVMGVAAR